MGLERKRKRVGGRAGQRAGWGLRRREVEAETPEIIKVT